MSSDVAQIEFYLKRATELRLQAETLQTEQARSLLLNIADRYERLADKLQLERRSGGQ